ncbi:MAG TPA: hypothetical protein PKD84_08015 [Propionicimonas sp.]|nr:hypothetical protein [Propionicimonas sp.]
MPENLLEHVQGDAGVGHPGRSGVPQLVTGEVAEAEPCHEVVPAARVAHGGGREDSTAWSAQERIAGLLAVGEALEDGFDSVEHREGTVSAAFGLLDDEATFAGIVLVSDPRDPVVPVHVSDPETGVVESTR